MLFRSCDTTAGERYGSICDMRSFAAKFTATRSAPRHSNSRMRPKRVWAKVTSGFGRGTKRQAWAQLELSEQRDAISLYSLRKAARALDCDVVYYLVPHAGAEAPAGTDAKPADAIAVAPTSGTTPPKPAEKPADSGWFNDDLRTELL